ncbi:MAG: hypothetical protein QOK17_775 [Sphingomonadales bacterium]|nr:hypothetical protein [Sphingomonadales bacterium]
MEESWTRVPRILIALAMAICLLVQPTSATSQDRSTRSSNVAQMVQRCHRLWVPDCANYGVEDPNKPRPADCAITWQPGCPGEDQAVQSLVRGGPSIPTTRTPLQFSARGFIQNGWPIVIKYRVPAGAIATLTVTPLFGGGAPFRQVLPASEGSDRLYSFVARVPGSKEKVVVADYTIAARDEASNAAVPVTILGFGAGPRAVGSIAIDKIRTDPPTVQRPTGKSITLLTFTYFLENDWDLVSEDLWRACTKLFCQWSHPTNPYAAPTGGPHTWEWKVNRKAKLGQYQLVIRAWHTCGAQVNLQTYGQCGKQLDWVVGSAGPVFIQ